MFPEHAHLIDVDGTDNEASNMYHAMKQSG
jgi:hypothetical protein